MYKLIFCRRLAELDITVTPSVKCMDWLHQWYNHAAHSVSSSTALAVLNNTSEKRKCTSHSAMQVRNWCKTVGTEGKLDMITDSKRVNKVLYMYVIQKVISDVLLRKRKNIFQTMYTAIWCTYRTLLFDSSHHSWGICHSVAPVFVSPHRRMMLPAMQSKWWRLLWPHRCRGTTSKHGRI